MGKILKYSLLVCFAFVIAAGFTVAISSSDSGKKEEGVRVVAHSEEEVKRASEKGCEVSKKGKKLTSLTCSPEAASLLGLQEDVKVFAVDAGANTQTRANLVSAAGNSGQGRKVAVLDTGYNYTHPELASSYLGGKDLVNNDTDPLDDNGHGSHVGGLITADGLDPKAKGVATGTGILAVKVLDGTGGGFFSDVVEGIYFVVDGPDGLFGTADDFGVDAINMSLGTGRPFVYKGFCDGVLPDLTTAVKYAVDRNVVVVVAAGNNGTSGVSIPGCISHSTTVAAVDSRDKIAGFSGRGNSVDVSAPGVSLYSTLLGSQYGLASGTSMATPVVSGVVALIKNAHPGYTTLQVQDALFKTAKDLGKAGKDPQYGWGRVDAFSAVSF